MDHEIFYENEVKKSRGMTAIGIIEVLNTIKGKL